MDAAEPKDRLAVIFDEVFADSDAAERRAAVLDADPRSEREIVAPFEALDSVIAELCKRLEVLQAHGSSADSETTNESNDEDALLLSDAEEALSASEPPPIPLAESQHDADLGTDKRSEGSSGGSLLVKTKAKRGQEKVLLDEDIRWLNTISDLEGVLISLERGLVIGKPIAKMESFILANQARLIEVYRSTVFGHFLLRPERVSSEQSAMMPAPFLSFNLIATVLDLVNGQRSIQQIIDQAALTPLEVCCALSQLKRAGLVTAPWHEPRPDLEGRLSVVESPPEGSLSIADADKGRVSVSE